MKNNPPNTGKKNPTPEGKRKKIKELNVMENENPKVVSNFKEERDRPKSDPTGINWLICGFCNKKHLHGFPYIKSGGRHRERSGDEYCIYCHKIVKCYHHGKHIGQKFPKRR